MPDTGHSWVEQVFYLGFMCSALHVQNIPLWVLLLREEREVSHRAVVT